MIHKQEERWQIQNQNDFLLGFTLSAIQYQFWSFYYIYGRQPDREEVLEVGDIIFKRAAQIRETIFKAG